MYSSLISKVQKARRYAEEPERITFSGFQVSFRGENSSHTLSYRDGQWSCTCDFFPRHQMCSHSMALERILEKMLPAEGVPQQLALASRQAP